MKPETYNLFLPNKNAKKAVNIRSIANQVFYWKYYL